MSEPTGRDPIDELRHADPVAPDQLPSASLARLSARIQEAIMDTNGSNASRRRYTIPAAAGVVLAGIALIIVVTGTRPGIAPGASPTTDPGVALGSPAVLGPGAAFCVEQYSPRTLAERSFSFDGTVTGISGDEATFRVGHWFKGDAGDSITLTATGMTGTAITSAGGPHLEIGERYLVAGEDHFAWACGFTQPYDATVAAQWAEATGG